MAMAAPPPLPPTPARPPRRIHRLAVAVGIIAVALSIVLPRLFSRDAAPALARFFSVPGSQVTRITLRPQPRYGATIAGPITITKPALIDSILQSFRPATAISPNHPQVTFEYEIEITTASGTSFGTVSSTSNQGTLLWIHSSAAGGWNYGTYQTLSLQGILSIVQAGTADP